jgi:hypothetical protein
MCDARATGKEHVPPKCLFPEKKDLALQIDLRKTLYKVPSCDAHNSQKSRDDEYLLYILSSSYQINDIGRNLYRTKVRRAIKRNASILGLIAATATPVSPRKSIFEKEAHSIAYEVDANRFNTLIDRLARAIYYHHFKEKWLHSIQYQAEFLFASKDPSDRANLRNIEISRQANEWFSDVDFLGENPEAFKYQSLTIESAKIMRLHFYDGCKLLLFFYWPNENS